VFEPHSFDARVDAVRNGQSEQWTFSSIEGRTQIIAAFATRAGIQVAKVQPGTIREQLRLHGVLELAAAGRAEVRARFAGLITAVRAANGQTVRRGATLAIIESNESLSRYPLVAPISGVIASRAANVGEQTADRVLFEIVDPSRLEAHLSVFAADLTRVRAGQTVELRLTPASEPIIARIAGSAPRVDDASQSVEVRVPLPSQSGVLRPGLAVLGDVLIAERKAPLVVEVSALQKWRDMDVVFRRVGDIYEVQPVELGRRDAQWVEILSGIEAGADYVTAQSYLVKADIEKSGASHDH
jgi:cobalt-zinc-cadmium efflux system membrane fusion protein